ncbi:hypothetical protein Tco_0607667 [Tanacetum coccineum]
MVTQRAVEFLAKFLRLQQAQHHGLVEPLMCLRKEYHTNELAPRKNKGGKALSKNCKACKLALQHWLETEALRDCFVNIGRDDKRRNPVSECS